MKLDEQIRIIKSQLSAFDSLMEKMCYMSNFFDPDPEFTKEARDIVRSDIAKELKNGTI